MHHASPGRRVMSTRTVLITGGTMGLGMRTAEVIARDPSWHVVITGKDPARAAAAAKRVGAEAQKLDLGSLDDVRRFAAEFASGERPPLRALLCNAGIQHISGLVVSADGYEATFAVNHLGHFLLANLLLGELAPGARVVVVASDTHDPALKTGMPEPRLHSALELSVADNSWAGEDSASTAGRRRYTTSKLCNVLFAYEAARRWEGRGVAVNAFNPGLMPGTGLARDYPRYQQLAWRYVMPVLTVLRPGINTPRTSGRALARLATDASLDGISGTYWSGGEAIASSTESYDESQAADLWQTSLALVSLDSAAQGEPAAR
jgi:NAD(P)-dependent dehydrogenase (short-subunit alcohol dehydrogenase family)